MASLFKSKGKKHKDGSYARGDGVGYSAPKRGTGIGRRADGQPVSGGVKAGTFPLVDGKRKEHKQGGLSTSTSDPDVRFDEFGRPTNQSTGQAHHAPPAFVLQRPSHDSSRSAGRSSPPRQWTEGDMQLVYGYTGLFTERELDITETEKVVTVVADQIRSLGLEAPLLFSTKALDISTEGTHALIRNFVTNKREFANDVQIATPQNLSAFLKWILARHTNAQGGRGFLKLEKYKQWRDAEKAQGYPERFVVTGLLYTLPTQISNVLTTLFELFCAAAAYSSKNGMTIHKLAALFGSFVFGLPDDQPFDQTYQLWLQCSNALEHILLAYLRHQKAVSATSRIASRLELYIADYPANVPILVKPIKTARLEQVGRIRRHARFYSKNLVASAASWEVEKSRVWDRLFPVPSAIRSPPTSPKAGAGPRVKIVDPRSRPVFSNAYKHLLNIRPGFAEPEDDQDIEMQRFRSLVEKEWSGFISKGFEPPDETKLQFDLTETERTQRKLKHQTLDWSSFQGAGFAGRETFVPTDLQFSKTLEQTVVSWPEEKKELARKLRKTDKSLPSFPYDVTPHEEQPVLVDDNFFEAWADVLVASGWARDEIKESNWVLVQYRAKPRDGRAQLNGSVGSDGRSEEVWMLIEESIPASYREELMEAKTGRISKKAAFLRTVKGKGKDKDPESKRGKKEKPGALGAGATVVAGGDSPFLHSPVKRSPGDDLFDLKPGETRQMSLSQERLERPVSMVTTATVPGPSSIGGTLGHDWSGSKDLVSKPDLPPIPPAVGGKDEKPREHGRQTSFMAELRARARQRHAGYRLGQGSNAATQPTPFDYDAQTIRDPDSALHRDPARLETPSGRPPQSGSGSSDGWLDVRVRDESRNRYNREAYTPSPTGSSHSRSVPPSPVRARPANPSPPSDDESERRRPTTQVSQRSEGTFSDAEEDDDSTQRLPPRPAFAAPPDSGRTSIETDSAYGGVDENAPNEPRLVQASKISIASTPSGLRAMAAGQPSSPRDLRGRPEGSPVEASRLPLSSSALSQPRSNGASPTPPRTSSKPLHTPPTLPARSPFDSKARKVSAIVDMFEHSR